MAEKTLTTQIILRNGTTTEWGASTKVLKLGEIGIDTTKMKFVLAMVRILGKTLKSLARIKRLFRL